MLITKLSMTCIEKSDCFSYYWSIDQRDGTPYLLILKFQIEKKTSESLYSIIYKISSARHRVLLLSSVFSATPRVDFHLLFRGTLRENGEQIGDKENISVDPSARDLGLIRVLEKFIEARCESNSAKIATDGVQSWSLPLRTKEKADGERRRWT